MQTLLVGNFDCAEFSPVVEALAERCQIQPAKDMPDALAQLAAVRWSPDAVVLAWPCPGAFAARDISRLRTAAPLARQLAILGSWCEGKVRSGEIIPGLIRTVWHQWIPSWADDFQARTVTRLPGWGLPETAADEERLLARAARRWPSRSGLIAIASRRFDTAELHGEACRLRGYSTAWLKNGEDLLRIGRPALVIWDGDTDQMAELSSIRANSSAPIVALIDFPRADDVRRATEAGAAAVLSRPTSWDCLFWHLDRLDARHGVTQRVA